MFGIFSVHTDVYAWDCTWGLYGHVRESALKVDSERKIPWRTGDWNPRQYCAWLFSRTGYQLNYPRPSHFNDVSVFDDVILQGKPFQTDDAA